VPGGSPAHRGWSRRREPTTSVGVGRQADVRGEPFRRSPWAEGRPPVSIRRREWPWSGAPRTPRPRTARPAPLDALGDHAWPCGPGTSSVMTGIDRIGLGLERVGLACRRGREPEPRQTTGTRWDAGPTRCSPRRAWEGTGQVGTHGWRSSVVRGHSGTNRRRNAVGWARSSPPGFFERPLPAGAYERPRSAQSPTGISRASLPLSQGRPAAARSAHLSRPSPVCPSSAGVGPTRAARGSRAAVSKW